MTEYKINLKLASGASLDMLIFSDTEHRWIFKHRFMLPEVKVRRENPTLINDISLVVDYNSGIPGDCNLSMNITRPDKRGQKFLAGLDISEGAHLFAQFIYEKQRDTYKLKTIDCGVNKVIELNPDSRELIKPVDFPFPVKDVVLENSGIFSFPFLKSNGEESYFEFPDYYVKK
jgi:hypothetical protein